MIVRTVCALSDGHGCGLLAHVQNGVITKIEPADYPNRADRGACSKGLLTPNIVYHAKRLRYPLKRIGPRGEGRWQRVSWDEALDGISSRLREIAQRHGSTSVAWDVKLPFLQGAGYSRIASLTGGTWVDTMGFGDAAGPCADLATFGWDTGEVHLSSLGDPAVSIIWGYNPAVTDFRRMRKIMADKKKGSYVVVIDPRRTATAAQADEYVAIRPGTDGALALGMMQVVIDRALHDKRFVAEDTVGPLLVRDDNGLFLRESELARGGREQGFVVFDEVTCRAQPFDGPAAAPSLTGHYCIDGVECRPAFQLLSDMARGFTPEVVSEICDVPAEVIQRLAIAYATRKPSVIHRGWGLQRSFHGDLSCRAINALAAITGNIRVKRPSTFVLNTRPFSMPAGPLNRMPILGLKRAIVEGDPLAIKALFVAGQNFVDQLPNSSRIIDDLLPRLDLIVVSDLFMTTTARYADYVLPAAFFLECSNYHVGLGGINGGATIYLQLQQKVVDPPGDCKSDFQIAAELGRRMGYAQHFQQTEDECLEEILGSHHPTMRGISMALLREGAVAAQPLDRPREFRTSTGRIEFYSERLREFGQELPLYMEPIESARGEKATSYPLSLLSTHPRHRMNSTLANAPDLRKLEPEPTVEISEIDAEARQIADGDLVCVFNDRGRVKLRAKLSRRIRTGVVDITQGWWPEQYEEGHVNQLTHELMNPAQQAVYQPNAALYDVLVQVERVEKENRRPE